MSDPKPAILVVEDEIEWKDIIFGFLEPYGYLAMHAVNVEEAKRLLAQYKFSIVTVDLEFQKRQNIFFEEGPKLLKHIQQNYPEIPCIVISGSEQSLEDGTNLVLAFRWVVRRYLTKDDKKLEEKLIEEIEAILAERGIKDSSNTRIEESPLESREIHLKKLLKMRNENLQKLEIQRAQFGSLSTPLNILNAIDEEQLEIERITQELEELQKSAST